MKKILRYFKNFGFLKNLPNKFEISEGVSVSVGREDMCITKATYLYEFKKSEWNRNRNKREIS